FERLLDAPEPTRRTGISPLCGNDGESDDAVDDDVPVVERPCSSKRLLIVALRLREIAGCECEFAKPVNRPSRRVQLTLLRSESEALPKQVVCPRSLAFVDR